jgi:hypothetical protein
MARLSALPILAAAAVLWTAGCGSSAVTPGTTATPTVILTAEPAVTASSTLEALPSSTADVTAPPTLAPPPTAPPTPTNPPGSVSQCTGSAKQRQFLVDAASHLPFSVYCARLPVGWWMQTGQWDLQAGQWLIARYENSSGAVFELSEWNWCVTKPSECWPVGVPLGPAMFGNLDGGLVQVNTTPMYGIYVDPDTTHSYAAIGKGFTRAGFVAVVAGLVRLPRP